MERWGRTGRAHTTSVGGVVARTCRLLQLQVVVGEEAGERERVAPTLQRGHLVAQKHDADPHHNRILGRAQHLLTQASGCSPSHISVIQLTAGGSIGPHVVPLTQTIWNCLKSINHTM